MEWIVLGSGSAVSRGPRSPAGHAVRVGDEHLVFDTGPATLLRMGEAGIPFERVAHVFFTHLHLDHTADLVALLFARNCPDVDNGECLTLWGPEGFEDAVRGLRAVYGEWIEGRSYRQEVRRFPGEVREAGWTVTGRAVEHIPGALGYRIESGGRAASYSGDTAYCDAIVQLSRGVDLAVLECSFPDDLAVPGHLTPRVCGRIAREAGAGRLLLTHLYPACEEIDVAAAAAREFDGEILVAEDLSRITV